MPKRSLICLCAAAIIGGNLHASENLVANGDFETRAAAPWFEPSWIQDAIRPQIDKAVFHGPGNASLTFIGEPGKRGFVLQQIKLPPDASKVKFGGWIKTEGFQNCWSALITLECALDSGGDVGYSYSNLATPWELSSTAWTKYEGVATLPKNTKSVRMILQTRAPNEEKPKNNVGRAWFDNIFVE